MSVRSFDPFAASPSTPNATTAPASAIVATYYFIRRDDTAEIFKIAEVLVNDDHDLIHKAVGGWVREAGKRDPDGLLDFLDRFAATMPRTALRYAVEHLDRAQRDHYMGLKKQA
jgi:3-methyladenine DNA glycosylase AlkD